MLSGNVPWKEDRSQICEDCPEAFEPILVENEVVLQLIYSIMQHFMCEDNDIRRLALSVMNILIGHIPPSHEHIIEQCFPTVAAFLSSAFVLSDTEKESLS